MHNKFFILSGQFFLLLSLSALTSCGLGGAEIHSRVAGFDFNPSYTVFAFEAPSKNNPEINANPVSRLITVLTWASYDPSKPLSNYSAEEKKSLMENFSKSDGLIFVTDMANIVPGKSLETFTSPSLANTRAELTYWLNSETSSNLAGNRHFIVSIDKKTDDLFIGRFVVYFSTAGTEQEGISRVGSVFGGFDAPLLTGSQILKDMGEISESIPRLKEIFEALNLDLSGENKTDK